MKIKDIFKNDITRHIEGVIKADDREHIKQEVDEYVITQEIQSQLDQFFQEYAKDKNSNVGVWISGFFGSGKSHLLKILSYILENEEIDGSKVGDIFLDKLEDFELKANIEKAVNIPAQSILFNIDQKAEISGIQDERTLLPVFVKTFNQFRGYSPTFSYIADFEHYLDRKDVYGKFKEEYKKIAGETWENEREAIRFRRDQFRKALQNTINIEENDINRIIEELDKEYSISIEDFAKRIKAYLDQRSSDFRLVFCVDEMGQYIADNTNLMLNLQTLSETLSTVCEGRAWLIVTAQSKIDAIIGEVDSRQRNDFSRIQARFDTRLNLGSQNVDEVIHKRLLDKTDKAKIELERIYENEQSNFRTIFTFEEGTRQYQVYDSSNDFINKYPFVPYQFYLFQSVITGLSDHNSFQGRHQSVGERSMLGVFQIVSQKLLVEPVGRLATFNLFYEGIKSTLRGEIQSSISTAEKNINNEFTLRILRILFLLKYVNEFQCTVKNLSILMMERFDDNLFELQKQIKESLNLLEKQSYIQQIGGVYEFLTDDEKDVEDEIKATSIDESAVVKEFGNIIYDEILRDNKIRYDDNNQDYNFAKKLDDSLLSREDDLVINIITPFYEDEADDNKLKMKTMGSSELLVKLDDDLGVKDDHLMYLKTERYLRHATQSSLTDTKEKIIRDKRAQNDQRKQKIKEKLNDLIAESKLFLNGAEINVSGTDAKTRIKNAFQNLVKTTFSNLQMLDANYKEEDIKTIVLSDDLLITDGPLSEAEQEVFNFIDRKNRAHESTTTKDILEAFSRKPYGWYQAAILSLIAKLYKRNNVSLLKNQTELNKNEVNQALNSNREFSVTQIKPVEVIPADKVNRLKNFYRDFFDETIEAIDAKEVFNTFKNRLQREIEDLNRYMEMESNYPFLSKLREPVDKLKRFANKDFSTTYNEIGTAADEFLDFKEDVIDPIKTFMTGEKRNIYDSINSFWAQEQANLDYINSEEVEVVREVKDASQPYKSNKIPEAKRSLDKIREDINKTLEEERKQAKEKIEGLKDKIKADQNFKKISGEDTEKIIQPFDRAMETVEHTDFISSIRDKSNDAVNRLFQEQLSRLISLTESDEEGGEPKQLSLVSFSNIKPQYKKTTLDSEEDVEDYIQQLKDKLIQEIKENHKIILY